jgi:hypothetical protein
MTNQLKVIDGCVYVSEINEWVSIDSLNKVNKMINYYEGK